MKPFKITLVCVSIFFAMSASANDDINYAHKFKTARLATCDNVFHQLEKTIPGDMYHRDFLVNAWAECWKRSMNAELDQRLTQLKKNNVVEFHAEMELQKQFNQATEQLCGKNCNGGGTMHGLPYNFCRVDAYKYRTAQAMQMNANQLSIPVQGNILPTKIKNQKSKDTKFYTDFITKLCTLPTTVWQGNHLPADCQRNAALELDGFEFTDDVCDLS
jgi:hypothetical protein